MAQTPHPRVPAVLAAACLAVAAGACAPGGTPGGTSGGTPGGESPPPPTPAPVAQPACDEIWQRPDGGTGFYETNPVYEDVRDDSAEWRVVPAAAHGIDADLLDEGADLLAETATLRSIIVLRHGDIVFERYVHGGSPTQSRNVHSASKSILQAVIGIAVARGDLAGLEDTLGAHLPADLLDSPAKARLTIDDLLTMRSGLDWREDRAEEEVAADPDRVRAILARPLIGTPGSDEDFRYSTGNTHVLSAVLQNATGTSTCEYTATHLFAPLGITAEHWGRDPAGVFAGGHTLYLRPRELARFGQLYLDRGRVGGTEVVPARTVEEAATEPHSCDPADGWCYTSGWWWTSIAGHDAHVAWGFGGQLVYVIPDLDLVFSQTQDTAGDPQESAHEAFVADHLIPAVTGP